jgi:hypothetical protein
MKSLTNGERAREVRSAMNALFSIRSRLPYFPIFRAVREANKRNEGVSPRPFRSRS